MTYIQIEDAFFDHPKVLRVSKDAKLLAVAAICYCGRELTDGFIPTGAVPVLAAKTGVSKPAGPVKELLDARLWELAEGGYLAHDYLVYNASAEKVRANREATRERMRRLRAPDVRAHNDQTSGAHFSNNDECAPNVRDSTTTTTSSSALNSATELGDGGVNAVHRANRLPDIFTLTEDLRRWAESNTPHIDIEFHHQDFCRYWWSKSGKDATKLDWVMTWQRWMAKEEKDSGKQSANGRASPNGIVELPPPERWSGRGKLVTQMTDLEKQQLKAYEARDYATRHPEAIAHGSD